MNDASSHERTRRFILTRLMFSTLNEFIDALDAVGELHRIRAEVSPLLEITEMADDPAYTLSGGQLKLLEIGRALFWDAYGNTAHAITVADAMLCDEIPLAHLVNITARLLEVK